MATQGDSNYPTSHSLNPLLCYHKPNITPNPNDDAHPAHYQM